MRFFKSLWDQRSRIWGYLKARDWDSLYATYYLLNVDRLNQAGKHDQAQFWLRQALNVYYPLLTKIRYVKSLLGPADGEPRFDLNIREAFGRLWFRKPRVYPAPIYGPIKSNTDILSFLDDLSQRPLPNRKKSEHLIAEIKQNFQAVNADDMIYDLELLLDKMYQGQYASNNMEHFREDFKGYFNSDYESCKEKQPKCSKCLYKNVSMPYPRDASKHLLQLLKLLGSTLNKDKKKQRGKLFPSIEKERRAGLLTACEELSVETFLGEFTQDSDHFKCLKTKTLKICSYFTTEYQESAFTRRYDTICPTQKYNYCAQRIIEALQAPEERIGSEIIDRCGKNIEDFIETYKVIRRHLLELKHEILANRLTDANTALTYSPIITLKKSMEYIDRYILKLQLARLVLEKCKTTFRDAILPDALPDVLKADIFYKYAVFDLKNGNIQWARSKMQRAHKIYRNILLPSDGPKTCGEQKFLQRLKAQEQHVRCHLFFGKLYARLENYDEAKYHFVKAWQTLEGILEKIEEEEIKKKYDVADYATGPYKTLSAKINLAQASLAMQRSKTNPEKLEQKEWQDNTKEITKKMRCLFRKLDVAAGEADGDFVKFVEKIKEGKLPDEKHIKTWGPEYKFILFKSLDIFFRLPYNHQKGYAHLYNLLTEKSAKELNADKLIDAVNNFVKVSAPPKDSHAAKIDALVCLLLGRLCLKKHLYTDARLCTAKAEKIYSTLADFKRHAYSLALIGDIYAKESDLPQAEQYYKKALKLSVTMADRTQEQYLLYKVGQLNRRNAKYPMAERALKLGAVMADSSGALYNKANCCIELAAIYEEEENIEQSENYFQMAEKALAKLQEGIAEDEYILDQYDDLNVVWNLRKAKLAEKKYIRSNLADDLKASIDHNVDDYRLLNNDIEEYGPLEYKVIVALATLYVMFPEQYGKQVSCGDPKYQLAKRIMKELNASKDTKEEEKEDEEEKDDEKKEEENLLTEARNAFMRSGDRKWLAKADFALGKLAIYLKKGDALQNLDSALYIFRSLNDRSNEALCLEAMGDFYYWHEPPRYTKALEHYRKAADLFGKESDNTIARRLHVKIIKNEEKQDIDRKRTRDFYTRPKDR